MKLVTETERLYLREFTPEDAVHFYAMNLDENVIKYTGDVAFKTLVEAEAFLKNYSDYKKHNMGRWAVCLKSTHAFLGWCGLKYHENEKYVEVGYRFYKKHWNTGYATESAKAAICYGFENLKLSTIYAHTHIHHKVSQHVLSKCGLAPVKEDYYDGMPSILFKIENPFLAIKTIEAKETYAVRQPILRPGRPFEECEFINDTHPDTFHLGLYFKLELIGVVTFMINKNDTIIESNQYQLRGMAILKDYQGLKYGDLLIKTGESLVKERQGKLIWLNAREIAVRFYERNGFKVSGDAFNIPKVGTHYMMYKTV